MNEYASVMNPLFKETAVNQIEIVLSTALNIVENQTDSVWARFYHSYLPPAIASSSNYEIPLLFKHCSPKFLKEAHDFYNKNKNVPMSLFMLGQYQEYVMDSGHLSSTSLDLYKKGSQLKCPFSMFKVAELLIKDNEKNNRKKILKFLMMSFFITSIEPYKLLNCNIMTNYHSDYWSIDSFWYLSYYWEIANKEFREVLDETVISEKFSEKFKECLITIFTHLNNRNEYVNILKMLEETITKYSDKKAAFHFCMFSFFIIRISDIPVNIEYIVTILKYLADDGNIYACEKLALYLDCKRDYVNAFMYMSKAEAHLLPTSIGNLGNYYCSIKNPVKSVDINKANEYWKKASYFGQYISVEYLKLIDINKDYTRFFWLANFSYLTGSFGSEMLLGECYEKGKGVDKNLKTALAFYKMGLRKHKEGCGFLYRIARTLEKQESSQCQDFYKVCFTIYNKLYEEDKLNVNNMWILDAYRLASMYGVGRGVRKDVAQSLKYIDEILNANISIDTSSYVCLYYYTLAIKKKLLYTKQHTSSIITLRTENSLFNNNIGYDHIGQINRMANAITESDVVFSVPETNTNTKKYAQKPEIIKESSIVMDMSNSRMQNSKSSRMNVDKSIDIRVKTNSSISENRRSHNFSDPNYEESLNSTVELEEATIKQIKALFSKKKHSKSNNMDAILIQGYIENIKKMGAKIIDTNNIVYDELIGNGGYSKVYAGWYNGNKVAVKEFKTINEFTIKKIFEEINVQISLKNDRINKVLYLGLDAMPLKVCCINKFMLYNLRFVINNMNLKLLQKLFIAKQVIEAIDFMHSQSPPIVHRDLKPENILMNDDFIIELCDFGVYKTLQTDKTICETLNQFYTVRYAPPEVIKNYHFICKGSDIWSFGLVLYDLFYEHQPWFGLSSEEVIDAIKKEKPFSVKSSDSVPSSISTIIKKCVNYDYAQRPKASEMLKDIIKTINDMDI